MVWGAIIGAVASVASSAIASRSSRGGSSTSVNYEAMVRNAQKAGINPLTALRNGGAAGHTMTHHPALSSAQIFADGFQGFMNGLGNYQAHKQETTQQEQKLLVTELQRIQQENEILTKRSQPPTAGSFLLGPPSATAPDEIRTGPRLADTNSTKYQWRINQAHQPVSKKIIIGERTVTNPYPTGSGAVVNKNFADTELWERRHGDFIGGIQGGIVTNVADTLANYSKFAEALHQQHNKKGLYQFRSQTNKRPQPADGSRVYYPDWLPSLSIEWD